MRRWTVAAGLTVLAAAMWFAWLGWDHEYYQADGVWQGPYRAWQVIGCGATIAAATVLAHLGAGDVRTRLLLPIAGAVGFAVPWSIDASEDETGTWLVGLVLALVGISVALAVLLVLVEALRGAPASPAKAIGICLVLTLVLAVAYLPLAIIPLAAGAWIFLRHRRTTSGAS